MTDNKVVTIHVTQEDIDKAIREYANGPGQLVSRCCIITQAAKRILNRDDINTSYKHVSGPDGNPIGSFTGYPVDVTHMCSASWRLVKPFSFDLILNDKETEEACPTTKTN